ncbi:type II toxin-antitoxin system tRNA(fMet)-specific endonuclease VapC [Methyloprofundus sp.]|uniref:type II toxin-antitoxin system tRNA(fMet)-specific endonuclease VapC n=1 Tax=Methyloprofundus sp. TaxID=2020875 RepID=UPI003D10C4BC
MKAYLLDTNICIYLIKQHPPEVLQRFQQIQIQQLHIPTISIFELYYGIAKNNSQQRNLKALENFIAPLTVVDFSIEAAKKAASIRATLEKQGNTIGAYDIQIAAVASSLNMTLLTNNTREFERVEGLKLENWVN